MPDNDSLVGSNSSTTAEAPDHHRMTVEELEDKLNQVSDKLHKGYEEEHHLEYGTTQGVMLSCIHSKTPFRSPLHPSMPRGQTAPESWVASIGELGRTQICLAAGYLGSRPSSSFWGSFKESYEYVAEIVSLDLCWPHEIDIEKYQKSLNRSNNKYRWYHCKSLSEYEEAAALLSSP